MSSEGIYEGIVISFDPTTGAVVATIPQRFGQQPQVITPALTRSSEVSRIIPVYTNDRVRVFFPGSDDSPPKWIPAIHDYSANPNNALGIIATGTFTFGDNATFTNGADLTNGITATLLAGRRYRVTYTVRAVQATATATFYVNLFVDGVGTWDRYTAVPVNTIGYAQSHAEWIVDGDGASHVYKLVYFGGGTVVGFSSGGLYYIEDMGPSVAPVLPLPPTPSTFQAWTPLTFNSPWTNYGGGWNIPGFRKIGDIVYLRGLCVPTSATSTFIAVLPVGYRPPGSMLWTAQTNTSPFARRCDLSSAGEINAYSAGAGEYVSLENVNFSTTA